MNKLNTFLGLVFSLALASPAQAVSPVMWDTSRFSLTEVMGTLNEVGVTFRSDSESTLQLINLDGADFDPPLETTIALKFESDFTVTFD